MHTVAAAAKLCCWPSGVSAGALRAACALTRGAGLEAQRPGAPVPLDGVPGWAGRVAAFASHTDVALGAAARAAPGQQCMRWVRASRCSHQRLKWQRASMVGAGSVEPQQKLKLGAIKRYAAGKPGQWIWAAAWKGKQAVCAHLMHVTVVWVDARRVYVPAGHTGMQCCRQGRG